MRSAPSSLAALRAGSSSMTAARCCGSRRRPSPRRWGAYSEDARSDEDEVAPLPEVCARDTCAPMIDLYYWPTPNGWKISIMLEECSLPYTLKPVNIGRGEQFSPAFLRLSPNNRMPAIVDHDPPGGGDPVAIFESAAILQYLAEKAGRFLPRDVRGRCEVLQWVAWQVANLGPVAGQLNHFANYATEKIPYAIERFANEMNRLLGVLERRPADRPYLAGEYSIADIATWPWVFP